MGRIYDNRIKDILNITDPSVNRSHLNSFAYLISSLIHSVGQKGHGYKILSFNSHLNRLLAPRVRDRQFSQKDLYEQPPEYFEYFNDLNRAVDELAKGEISEIFDRISDLEKQFNQSLPMIKMDNTISTAKHQFQIKHYFDDYLTSITDHYESFLLISLYMLILFKLLADEDVKGNLKSFQTAEKLSAHIVYSNPKKTNGSKLLRCYISESSLLATHKQEILELFDYIFAEEGIRGLRNKKIHHYAEDQIKFVDEFIEVTYSTGTVKQYTLFEIHQIKNNLQLVVILGFMVVTCAMYFIIVQILEKESQEDDNPQTGFNV